MLNSLRPTNADGRFLSADSRGCKILNMFDRASRPTATESVVESANSTAESAESENPVKIGLLVRALSMVMTFQIAFYRQTQLHFLLGYLFEYVLSIMVEIIHGKAFALRSIPETLY